MVLWAVSLFFLKKGILIIYLVAMIESGACVINLGSHFMIRKKHVGPGTPPVENHWFIATATAAVCQT